jgi:transketolase
MDTVTMIEQKTAWAKHKVLEMCVHANLGHLTTAYSCAEIVATLYYGVMHIDPKNPQRDDRDRFIMSKNHGSVMTYPILADIGFFDLSELDTFMSDGTRLGGHSKLGLPGVDFSGGSLGIGLGVAAGLAYSAKMDNKKWLTFTIVGDAECYEGSIWEAAMFASHNKLHNLIALLDRNRLGVTGFTEDLLRLEPIADKWEAFGWEVRTVNGHSIHELLDSLVDVRERKTNKPLMIIAETIKGNGIDFMSNEPLYHGVPPKSADIKRAFKQLEAIK